MVTLEGKAKMGCEKPGCTASIPVLLCLMGSGGLVFKPVADAAAWQVRAPMSGMGPFQTFCPEHKQTVEPVRSVIAEAR